MNPAKVQLFYTLAELGRMIGREERAIARWLSTNHCPTSKVGRTTIVWIADLFAAFPELEKSRAIQASAEQE